MPRAWEEDYEEDEWHERDFHRGVSHIRPPVRPPPRRSGADLLSTDHFSSRLRSRSTGAQPAPNVYVYTSQHNDVDHSPSPDRIRAHSRGRPRDDRNTTDIADRLEDIDRDLKRMSSRRRTPDFLRDPSPAVNRMELELVRQRAEREKEIERERLARDREIEKELERERILRSREIEKHGERERHAREQEIQREVERERFARHGEIEKERYARERLEDKINMELNNFNRQKESLSRRDGERLREAEYRAAELEKERIKEIEERDQALYKKKLELARLKDRIEREEEEAKLEQRDKEWKSRLEMEKLKDEQKRAKAQLERQEEKNKLLAEMDRKAKEAKAERNRIKQEIEAKEREEEEERKEIVERALRKEKERKEAEDKKAAEAVAAFEKKKRAEKEEEEEMKQKFRLEEEAKKKKEKEEEEKIKAKLKAEEEKEKEKKKAEEKRIEDEMHKRLSKFGFQENQIEAVLDPKKAANLPAGASPGHALTPYARPPHGNFGWRHEATPTYIKVHRSHVDIETLKYFGLPWEYDTDTEYIVILQEMDTHETELLFEHTRKLRRGGTQLLIEERGRHGDKNQYAFVRRRKPSASPSRSRKRSPVRVGLGSLF